MLFLAVVVVMGLVWRRTKRFWSHAAAAFLAQFLAGFLFYAGGTLQDPTGDGLVTAVVREATGDGPLVALLAFPALLLGWGVPIWLLVRGWRTTTSPPAKELAQEARN